MDEQTRNADSRIKSYIDTIDALNKKEAASRSQAVRLKQEAEGHQRELSALRGQLNARKLEVESEITKSTKLEKDLLEAKSNVQLLRGKYEALEKRMSSDKSKWDEEVQSREKINRNIAVLQAEIENLRQKSEKDYSELSRLRIENGRLKEEEKSRATDTQENMSTSMTSNKRGLLDEIERKNGELQSVLHELKNKQIKIDKLNNTIEELNVKLRTSEREVGMLKSSSNHNQHMAQSEHFISTSPVAINSSRPSTSGGYFSQQGASSGLLVQQKDQEIADLKSTIADLRHEIDEKTSKMQGLIRFLGDSESGFGDKEKRLEAKIDQKDKELCALRQEMIDREEENGRLRMDIEEKYEILQVEKETLAINIDHLKEKLSDSDCRLTSLEAKHRTSTSEVDRLKKEVRNKEIQISELEEEFKEHKKISDQISDLNKEVQEKDNLVHQLQEQIDTMATKLTAKDQLADTIKSLEDQVEYLGSQCHKANTTLRRYQEVGNALHYHTVKCDTVYRGGVSVFVKYARSIYIPLVFNYQTSVDISEVGREASLESLETHAARIRKMQDHVQAFDFVLDLQSLPPRLKKILDGNAMVVVCRVDNVVREKVDLKTNKELVSFVQSGAVNKVQVDEVLCLMSASFDNAIDASEFRMVESGGQNKTFQY